MHMNKKLLALTLGVLLALTTASAAFAARPMSTLDLEGDGDEIEYKFGEITLDEAAMEIDFDFSAEDEFNHGGIVSSAVALLKAEEDLSDYRLGCLVRQVAKSDLGKKDVEDDTLTISFEGCEKKKVDTVGDEEDRGGPPPWAGPKDQRTELPPGQAKKAGN
jgi:hypothetical protein